MAFDGISAHFLNQELQTRLLEARISLIYQVDQHTLYIQCHKERKAENVMLSINPAKAALYFTTSVPHKHKKQSTFALLLKKQLLQATIVDIHNEECERIFTFTVQGTNDIGDPTEYDLVVEIMGRHSNIILLYPNGVIYDAMRHIDHSINRYREVMPARHYVSPPKQTSYTLSDYPQLIESGISHLYGQSDDGSGSEKVERHIVQTFAGFSPVLAREIMFRAGIDEQKLMMELSDIERHALQLATHSLLEDITKPKLQPAIYYIDEIKKHPCDFHLIPLHQFTHHEFFPSYGQVLATFFAHKTEDDLFQEWKQKAQQQLRKLQKKNARKRLLHEEDLREGMLADTYKLYGDLLQVKIYQLPPKTSSVKIENYYEEDLPLVTIPLDPSRSAADNIEHYYNMYRKAQEKSKRAKALLLQDEHEYEWLSALQSMLDHAESPEDISALIDEMTVFQDDRKDNLSINSNDKIVPHGQIINPGKPGKKGKFQLAKNNKTIKKRKPEPVILAHGFREFETSDGFLVLVGRNNIDNDRLTFKKSRKDDLWFHVRQRPGSHTVLQLNGQEPSSQAIEEAAQIAAYYSSANKTAGGIKVDVDYCFIKHVTRIPKAKPGLVNYSNFKTCYVEAKLPSKAEEGYVR